MKKTCLLLVLSLLLACFTPLGATASVIPTPEEELNGHLAVLMGDADGDSAVTARDALMALKFSVRKIEYIESFGGTNGTNIPFEADLNGDRTLNAVDALQMLKISVDAWTAQAQYLSSEEFSTILYPMPETVGYVAPQVIDSAHELEHVAEVPWDLEVALQDFPFEEYTMLLFSTPITSFGAPKAVQVVTYQSSVLVRYECETAAEAKQYAVAVALPKEKGQLLSSVYAEPTGPLRDIRPSLYSMEYPAEAMDASAYPTYRVIETEEEALELALFMQKYGLADEAMCQFLFYRIESGFFNQNKMVVWFLFGYYDSMLARYTVTDLSVQSSVATVVYAPETKEPETPPDTQSVFRMLLLDLTKDLGKNCTDFNLIHVDDLQGGTEGPESPTDIYFVQDTLMGLMNNQYTGIGGASHAAYIETVEQLEAYWAGCDDGKWFPMEKYNREYFEKEKKALLLFNGISKRSGLVENVVTAVFRVGNTLHVAVTNTECVGAIYTDDFYENLCVVELAEKLPLVDTLWFTVTYRELDQSQEPYQLYDKYSLAYTYTLSEGEWE